MSMRCWKQCKQQTTSQKMRVIIRSPKFAHNFWHRQKAMSILVGLNLCTKNSLKLLYLDEQVQVGDDYNELKNFFEQFQIMVNDCGSKTQKRVCYASADNS